MKLQWEAARGQGLALALGLVCLTGAAPARAQNAADAPPEKPSATRLLTVEEGRSIADAALQQDNPEPGTLDCSHLIHAIYGNAGFEYPYASSFELFAGHENFARVRYPRAGDLIVWPGHVGIVVDPLQHSFSSLVSTGFDVQDYESAYWRSRGRPRFYRYKVPSGAVLTAAKIAPSRHAANPNRPPGAGTLIEARPRGETSDLTQPTKVASERSTLVYGPMAPEAPEEATEASEPFEIPTSMIVATGPKPPTREEVAEGISELTDATGNLLRKDDPFKARSPVVIVEQFSVLKVETKRDHGWARLQVESRVSIDSGTIQRKTRRENVRWELRRVPAGWEVVTPQDRTYVPHDVAVKDLAAHLAQLTQGEAATPSGATPPRATLVQQESHIANLLSALLVQ
ncbi:MAG TPA: NlpC/P60 family protein [Candidatus Acidoferrum sp.]|nr:NlpC/P60 family protein [Candidatus Acidoferrum sp.]